MRFQAILHCFTGGRKLALAAVDLGLYVSFSGVVTFKKSEALRAIACEVPLERLLVETDAPYLAPDPYRGKRNETGLCGAYGRSFGEGARDLGGGAGICDD